MRKITNLRSIWEESFEIKELRYRENGSEVQEVELNISNLSQAPFDFNESWSMIHHLAQRQGFYAMPITENNGEGAEVLLVRKAALYNIDKRLLAIHKNMRSEYWLIQGDANCKAVYKETREIAGAVEKILKELRMMRSGLTGQRKDYLFEDFMTIKAYKTFRKKLSYLKDVALEEMKLENSTYRAIEAVYKEAIGR